MVPVQSKGTFNAASGASLSLAFDNPVTPGNLLVCYATCWSSQTRTFTVSDNINAGNYNADVTNGGTGHCALGIFSKFNTLAGTPTITVAISTNDVIAMVIEEWPISASSSPLDQVANSSGISTTASSGATATTGQPVELVLGALCTNNSRVVTAGSGFVLDLTENTRLATEYLTTSSPGAQTATFTWSSSSAWQCQCATYNTITGNVLTASLGSFSFIGEAATLTFGTGSISFSAATGSFSLLGENATLTPAGNFALVANPGAYDLLGGLSTSDDHMDAIVGQYLLQGGVVAFNGATFSVTGDRGLFALTGPTTLLTTSLQFTLIALRGNFIETVSDISGAVICATAAQIGAILNLEIVTEAFQKIGVVDETQAPSAEQGANGLRILNDYLLNQAADGMRLGWFQQTDLAAIAPLRAEDVWGVKVLLARQLASHYGITVQDPLLLANMVDAERLLTKRSIRYFESDLSELSRPQGGPFGGPSWFVIAGLCLLSITHITKLIT